MDALLRRQISVTRCAGRFLAPDHCPLPSGDIGLVIRPVRASFDVVRPRVAQASAVAVLAASSRILIFGLAPAGGCGLVGKRSLGSGFCRRDIVNGGPGLTHRLSLLMSFAPPASFAPRSPASLTSSKSVARTR